MNTPDSLKALRRANPRTKAGYAHTVDAVEDAYAEEGLGDVPEREQRLAITFSSHGRISWR